MIPRHLVEYPPSAIYEHEHPRLKTIEMLNYIRYLAEPRVGTFTQEAWQGEMERIHLTACEAIRQLGSEPGPAGGCLSDTKTR